jgi:hypothetical protein
MSYRLLLQKSVSKFLESRPENQRHALMKKLALLTENPLPSAELNIKIMQSCKADSREQSAVIEVVITLTITGLSG